MAGFYLIADSLAVSAEIRGWIALAATLVGGVIAYRSYALGQKQRRLENSFRMVTLFHEALQPDDMAQWTRLFHGSSPSAGAPAGYYMTLNEDGDDEAVPFGRLFAEGPPDAGATGRMAEVFDLVSREALEGTIDLRMVYFQLGQLMQTVYAWMASMDDQEGGRSFVAVNYPSFYKLISGNKIEESWSSRTYAYIG